MRCPFCGHEDTQVKDSRPAEDGAAIRRRRFCTSCGQRFTTVERVQLRELTVVKSGGRRQPFDLEIDSRTLDACATFGQRGEQAGRRIGFADDGRPTCSRTKRSFSHLRLRAVAHCSTSIGSAGLRSTSSLSE